MGTKSDQRFKRYDNRCELFIKLLKTRMQSSSVSDVWSDHIAVNDALATDTANRVLAQHAGAAEFRPAAAESSDATPSQNGERSRAQRIVLTANTRIQSALKLLQKLPRSILAYPRLSSSTCRGMRTPNLKLLRSPPR